MDRGAWWATIYRIARVGHNLATKPPPTIKKKKHTMVGHNLATKPPPTIKKKKTDDGPPSFSSPVHPSRTKHMDEMGQGQGSRDAWVHQSPCK